MLCAQYCLADTHSTAFTTSSSKASAAKALTRHILSGAYKAQLALPILSSRSVVSGFLSAAAELVVHAVQLLAAPLLASSNSQQQQRLTSQAVSGQGGQNQCGKQQQLLRGKGAGQKGSSKGTQQAKKGKQGRQGTASQDRLFTRRAQPRHNSIQQQQQQDVLSQGASPPASDADVDDMLYLFEAVLLYLVPAAVRGWDALGLAAAAAAGGAVIAGMGVWAHAGELQEEQQAAAAMLQSVLSVLTAVFEAGKVQERGRKGSWRTLTFMYACVRGRFFPGDFAA
jgi:hypothetical protein